MTASLQAVVVPAIEKHTATVIWLHGFGDSGAGWIFLAESIGPLLPHVKWVLPNAPLKPIKANGNMPVPAWFDIPSFDKSDYQANVDEKGMLGSVQSINDLIQSEIDSGIPADRIVLGGFSQGCVITLLTALTTTYKLAGFVACSGWLAIGEKAVEIAKETNKSTPIMICHGDEDVVVKFRYGRATARYLAKIGFDISFREYAGLGHAAGPQEVADIARFLKERLPSVDNSPRGKL